MERAIPVRNELINAVISVRAAVMEQACLKDEEWASLTKHVGELAVCARYGLFKATSNDSVIDAVRPTKSTLSEFIFSDSNENDRKLLLQIGIQIKCRRKRRGSGYGTTGNVNLASPFAELYAVWLNDQYTVIEVYKLSRDQVVQIVQGKNEDKNQYKLPYSMVKKLGTDCSKEVKDIGKLGFS